MRRSEAVRWANDCACRLADSPGGGRLDQCADLPAWAMECADDSETVFAMMRVQWDFKAQRHRAWAGFEAHLAYAMAGFMD